MIFIIHDCLWRRASRHSAEYFFPLLHRLCSSRLGLLICPLNKVPLMAGKRRLVDRLAPADGLSGRRRGKRRGQSQEHSPPAVWKLYPARFVPFGDVTARRTAHRMHFPATGRVFWRRMRRVLERPRRHKNDSATWNRGSLPGLPASNPPSPAFYGQLATAWDALSGVVMRGNLIYEYVRSMYAYAYVHCCGAG